MGTFRSALRALRRNAGFSLGAIAVLALGIAASASIFSVVDAILLKPLRFPHAERLVRISATSLDGHDKLALSNYFDLARETAADFDHTAAYYPRVAALTEPDGAVQVALGAVTSSFFATGTAISSRASIFRSVFSTAGGDEVSSRCKFTSAST